MTDTTSPPDTEAKQSPMREKTVTDHPPIIKCAVFREAQSKFRLQVSTWVAAMRFQNFVSAVQSESDGNVTLTVFYF